MVKFNVKKLAKALQARPKKVNVKPLKNIRRISTSNSAAKNILMADDSFFRN